MKEDAFKKIMTDLLLIQGNAPERLAKSCLVQSDALQQFVNELTGPNMVPTKATKDTTFAGLRIVANPHMHPDMFALVDDKNEIITVQYWRNAPPHPARKEDRVR